MAGMLEALLGLGWAALLQGKGDQRQGWAQDVQGATHPRTEGHVTRNRKARPGHTGQSLEQVSASGMRNRVSLLEGRSKGQRSPEPARWGGGVTSPAPGHLELVSSALFRDRSLQVRLYWGRAT